MSKPLLAIYGGLLAGLSFWAGQQYQRPVSSACTDPSWSATLPTCCKADVPHESRTVPSAIKAPSANPAVVCGDMWDSTQGRTAYRCIPVATKVEVQK